MKDFIRTLFRRFSPNIKIKKSGIHNKGAFAKKNLPKGTRIIEYVGNRITKVQAEKVYEKSLAHHLKNKKNGSVYIFELNKRYDLDGNVSWNPAKYINHSCSPNCETEIVKGHIWIVAVKDIKKGEEITYNYGYDVLEYEDHPCLCGSENCVGYIVEKRQWPKLRRLLEKKKS